MNKVKILSLFTLTIALGALTWFSLLPSNAAGSAWNTRCDDNGYCEMFQRINADEKGTARLAEFAIGFPDGAKTARGVVVLPLGILVQPGVGMHVDEKDSFKFAINHCSDSGCIGYIDLNDAVLSKLKSGTEASFVFFATNGKKIRIPMSLVGFSKAFGKVKKN